MSTLVSKNGFSPFIRFLPAELETRRQRAPQAAYAFDRLFGAAIARQAEFPFVEDPDFDPVALLECQGLHHGGRKTDRQTVSPFCNSHRYTFLLYIFRIFRGPAEVRFVFTRLSAPL